MKRLAPWATLFTRAANQRVRSWFETHYRTTFEHCGERLGRAAIEAPGPSPGLLSQAQSGNRSGGAPHLAIHAQPIAIALHQYFPTPGAEAARVREQIDRLENASLARAIGASEQMHSGFEAKA